MSQFLQRARVDLQSCGLLSAAQNILVATSGGVDSMVLLQVLQRLRKPVAGRLAVAHFNHQLRGRASDADERLVRQTAERLGLPCFVERAAVKTIAARKRISIEMAARQLRHEFLARTAREQGLATIALAHHADDQVELFFLRLFRGTGSEGLAGMKWRSPSPVDPAVTLVRPLLGFSKPELLAYAQQQKIHFREDATNAGTDILRNRIRHRLLPLLRKDYQPGLDKTVLRLMEILGAEADWVGAQVHAWDGQGGVVFADQPVALQRQVLRRQLTELGLAADFDLVEQLRLKPEKFVSLSRQQSVARSMAGKIQCRERHPAPKSETSFNPAEQLLAGSAGKVEFGDRKFSWRTQAYTGIRPPARPQVEVFDADRVGPGIILRHWRAGDRFQPIGLSAPAKLQDLFVNARIPAANRRQLVLATTAGGDIFWVEGLRIGELAKLHRNTRRQFVWRWAKLAF